MMREILFRGKQIIDGKWAESQYPWAKMFCGNLTFDFDPETVGQFTGLTDKNGKKIFEGDIIKNEYEDGKYQYFKIIYSERTLCWKVKNKYEMLGRLCNVIGNMEVIGNIHDNPELLETA